MLASAAVSASGPRPDVAAFFRPRSAAIFGLSERTTTRMATNMRVPGVPLHGINPTRSEVGGVPCVPTLRDCPQVPELVVVAVGHGRIEAAIEDVLSVEGVRALVVPGLGAEAGPAAGPIARRVADRVLAAGLPMLGPNCMGFVRPGGVSPWITTLDDSVARGRVAVLAHSGSIAKILISAGPRIGFTSVVSAGNELVRDAADFVSHWAADPDTQAVGLFLETVRRPAAFEQALRELAEAGKVAIVVKVGTSELGAAGALAHTGAMVGSDRSFSALLRAYDAIRVDDVSEWLEHLELAGCRRRPRGARIGGMTISGGEGEYFADMAEAAGIPLHPLSDGLAERIRAEFPDFGVVGNPVDGWAIADETVLFPRVAELMIESGEIDVLVSLMDHTAFLPPPEAAMIRGLSEHVMAACEGTDVVGCVISTTTSDPPLDDLRWARDRDVPLLRGTAAALRALAARVHHAGRVPPARDTPPASRIAGAGALSEFDSATIAAGYDIAYVRAERCASPEEAVVAARRIGYPVVVKVDGVAHKARVGGVALHLADDAAVRAAAGGMGGRVIVAEQVTGGAELLVGALRDPDYGPIVVAGVGGGLAEALDLVSATLAPTDVAGARALVASVPAIARLVGGEPPAALIDAIVGVSRLVAEHPEIAEVDVNPLLVSAGRAVALDCLIVLEEAP